jgi:hypothetical protein
MTRYFLIGLILFCKSSLAQIDKNISDSLTRLEYSENYQYFDSLSIKLDSIEVKFKFNQKLIKAECYFTKSSRKLFIDYYLNNNRLFFVKTTQICPSKPELTCHSRYYIVADSINQAEYSSQKAISHGIRSLEEITRQHTCLDKFDKYFLRNYIFTLFFKFSKRT